MKTRILTPFSRHHSQKTFDMKRTVLVFGLIAGVIVSAFMGTSMAIVGCMAETNYELGMVIGFSAMLVAFAFVFVGIKSLRDKQLGGSITFGKAFLAGTIIAFIASTMYVITWAIEYNFFMPDFMDNYVQHMIDEATLSGKSAAEIDAMKSEMVTMKENYKNPVLFSLYTYMEILPLGIIVALISAAILKRKPKSAGTVPA